MIVAPSRLSVKEIDPALFASLNHQLLALIFENGRSDLKIKIAALQPSPVLGDIIILQFQFVTFNLRANQPVSISLRSRIVAPVARRGPSHSVFVDGCTLPAPKSTAFRAISHHLVRGIGDFDAPHLVRIARATLRRCREKHAFP